MKKTNKDNELIDLREKISQLTNHLQHLETENQTLKNIYDSLTEAVYVLDSNWQFIEVNKGAEKMYQYSREELLGASPATVAAPGKNDLNAVVGVLSEVKKTGVSQTIEFWAKRKNGEEFLKEVIINKSAFKGESVIVATAREITERHKSQLEIRKFKSISDRASHGNAIVDLNGNILYLNNYFAEIHGYTTEELIGKNLSVFHSKEQLNRVNTLNQKLWNEGSYSGEEVWHSHKNGTVFPMLMSGILIKDEVGKPLYMAATSTDISSLVKAEKERDLIFNHSVDMLCTADFNGYLQQINPAWKKILGWSFEELRSKPFIELIHPDDKDETYEAAKKLEKGEPALGFVNRYRTKDNDYKWLSWNTIPIKEEGIMLGIARDISEQRKIEAALLVSEEKFRSLYDNAPLSYQSLDKNGNFIDVNPTWLKTLGYKRNEVIGKNYSDFLHPDWKEHFRINFPKFKKRGYVKDIHFKLKHKNEQFLDVLFEGCIGYNPDGTFRQTYCVFKDISMQKKAEDELIRSEEQFRRMFSYANIGIIICDKNEKLVKANEQFLQLLETNIDEVLGKNVKSFSHPDDFENEQNYIKELQNGSINNYRIEKRLITRTNKIVWVDLAVTAIKNTKGETESIVCMVMDINQGKQYEKELIAAKLKAEESDRLKSAFLANMSHEIRTPMNGILGFTDLLDQPNLSRDTQNKYIQIIKKSGDRMLDTVNDIIDISKIDAGQVVVELGEVNLVEEIEALFLFFKPEAELKNLKLSLSPKKTEHSIVQSDKIKLVSILSNLIKNAIKYTDEGAIDITYELADKQFICSVTDSGIGIPQDRIKAIFNRFEQADIDDRSAREGSGLGLSIAESYAKMLNGKIEVVSEIARGSTFTFTMPVETVITTPQKNNARQNKKTNISKLIPSILIAEDDNTSFEYVSELLSQISVKVIRAVNGKEALDLAKNNPDLSCILMDIKLPLLDGYEVTKKIRAFNENIPIIAQTAYALQGEEEKARKAGCSAYISKPINKEELLELVSTLV